jgi:hypothetical protein
MIQVSTRAGFRRYRISSGQSAAMNAFLCNQPTSSLMSEMGVKTSGNQCARIRSALPQSSDVSGARQHFALVPILLQKFENAW